MHEVKKGPSFILIGGIFCSSLRNKVMTLSRKIVIYFWSLPGGAIVRKCLNVNPATNVKKIQISTLPPLSVIALRC